MPDAVRLTAAPLDTAAAAASVHDPAAGGVAVFLGCTRAERRADGAELVALDYHAYDALAVKQLTALAAAARQRWPVVRCTLLHRTGRVGLGEPSVIVAVSTPHRGEAFEACRWLIDSLKAVAAIWKQDVWSDGQRTWVEGVAVTALPTTDPDQPRNADENAKANTHKNTDTRTAGADAGV